MENSIQQTGLVESVRLETIEDGNLPVLREFCEKLGFGPTEKIMGFFRSLLRDGCPIEITGNKCEYIHNGKYGSIEIIPR